MTLLYTLNTQNLVRTYFFVSFPSSCFFSPLILCKCITIVAHSSIHEVSTRGGGYFTRPSWIFHEAKLDISRVFHEAELDISRVFHEGGGQIRPSEILPPRVDIQWRSVQ